MKKELLIELIPATCFYSNVRSMVSEEVWDKIRYKSYELANYKCEICGDVGRNQGHFHNIECHEIWEYDTTTYTQRLLGLISLCPKCHQVKHFGRSRILGKEELCVEHIKKVNGWTNKKLQKHIDESFELFVNRSKHEWLLDITVLTKDPYNVKIKLGKRKFKKPKWQK